ncbi:MAG: alpha/beta fold hydrolase [Mycobacterium sp.]
MTRPDSLTFGDIADTTKPLAVLVHGFPDTPHTWRHLGPDLASRGYRVVAPWLPGYDAPVGRPVSVGTYVRRVLDVRMDYLGDERAVLIGHDWGANAGYGVVATDREAFSRFVALAVPPTAALAAGIFSYAQLKRSFYIWFIQQVGLAEAALLLPGFWESLWVDWSPGYDPAADVAELRQCVTAENIADVVGPYRASFDPHFADPDTEAEAAASMHTPPVPTLCLHGANDGAIGAELLSDVAAHLPATGSNFEIVDGVGHFLHLERPEAIATKIFEWLSR